VAMEARGHARWFERLLAELKFELWIGDAAEIGARRVRKKVTAAPSSYVGAPTASKANATPIEPASTASSRPSTSNC
jgi:hypothetical protein